jgi:pimeloyl-ACP methyl ester carboxylesterase
MKQPAKMMTFFRHKKVNTSKCNFHVVESNNDYDRTVLFLHGWPQDCSAWEKVMSLAGEKVHAVAIDLPGIGKSNMQDAPVAKSDIAGYLHEVVTAMKLKHLTLVGHDVGGQVIYPYLNRYGSELEGAVIMDVVIPGIKPWEDVLRNPHIWHFRFHAIPTLPETLVSGKERVYFDYFYNIIAAHPENISNKARQAYVQAYSGIPALSTGFGWYRAFEQDAKENKSLSAKQLQIETPVLYLRGDHESGDITQYVEGLKEAGIKNVRSNLIEDCGHFAPEEQPGKVWQNVDSLMQNKL